MTFSSENRRQKVAECLRKGMAESEIAKIVKVSRQTVVRDVSCLKKYSQNWLDGLAKEGFIFEYRMALDKIKDRGYKLGKLLDEEKDVMKKVAIIRAMDDNDKLYLQMLAETPTVYALRKAMSKNVLQKT